MFAELGSNQLSASFFVLILFPYKRTQYQMSSSLCTYLQKTHKISYLITFA